jgi:hypothetical protein
MMTDAEIFRAAYVYGLAISLVFISQYVRQQGELTVWEAVTFSALVLIPGVNAVFATASLIYWLAVWVADLRGRVIWHRKR